MEKPVPLLPTHPTHRQPLTDNALFATDSSPQSRSMMQLRSLTHQQKLAPRRPGRSGLLLPAGRARPGNVAAFSTGSDDSSPLARILEWTETALNMATSAEATELQMLQQGYEVLGVTGNITIVMSMLAVSWTMLVTFAYGPTLHLPPPTAQLILQTAGDLASGSQLCWWVMFTAYNWRFQLMQPFYGCCFVLTGMVLPMAYSYSDAPSSVCALAIILGTPLTVFLRDVFIPEYEVKVKDLKSLGK